MNRNEAIERLEEIQRIAQRTTLYTQLPGKSAVIGGLIAVIGAIISYVWLQSWDFAALASTSTGMQFEFLGMWVVLLSAAVIQDIFIGLREAKAAGIEPVGRPGRLAAYSLTPSLIVAFTVSLKILLDLNDGESYHAIRYIAPVWMMCYGMGVYAAGLFSVRLPRLLGCAFIVAGALGLLVFANQGIIMVALTFGVFHMIFGGVVMARAARNSK